MNVFLDFEASSLADRSYPIEVAWVFEDGSMESYLIAPATDWTDWDEKAEAIHHIPRTMLDREGTPHDRVARRMLDTLASHELFASAPSWDGKWLSVLLRSAQIPRHALRLADTDVALRETARLILSERWSGSDLEARIANLLSEANARAPAPPAHRAAADARGEWAKWSWIRHAAFDLVAGAD